MQKKELVCLYRGYEDCNINFDLIAVLENNEETVRSVANYIKVIFYLHNKGVENQRIACKGCNFKEPCYLFDEVIGGCKTHNQLIKWYPFVKVYSYGWSPKHLSDDETDFYRKLKAKLKEMNKNGYVDYEWNNILITSEEQ